MITIPIVTTATDSGELLAPSAPFPADAVAIICDGTKYTVYQSGDTVPTTN